MAVGPPMEEIPKGGVDEKQRELEQSVGVDESEPDWYVEEEHLESQEESDCMTERIAELIGDMPVPVLGKRRRLLDHIAGTLLTVAIAAPNKGLKRADARLYRQKLRNMRLTLEGMRNNPSVIQR